MTAHDLLSRCQALGVRVVAGDTGTLRVSPPGVLSAELREQLRTHKPDLVRLLTAPPADVLSEEPCSTCGSRERWIWRDGREICRPCLILDLVPMTRAPAMPLED